MRTSSSLFTVASFMSWPSWTASPTRRMQVLRKTTCLLLRTTFVFHMVERMTRSSVRTSVSALPTETISSAMKQGRLGFGLSIFRTMPKTGLSSTPIGYGITVMRSGRLLFLHTELVNSRCYRGNIRTNPTGATYVSSAIIRGRTTSLTGCTIFCPTSRSSPPKRL